MGLIRDILRNESIEFCNGFLEGIWAFAHWKNGEQFVGTTGRRFKSVRQIVEKIIEEKKRSPKK